MAIVSQPANDRYRANFAEVFKKTETATRGNSDLTNVPRRNRMDLWSAAEHAIRDAVQAVEAMPADVRLTQAVLLLQQAKDKVADFIDGIGRCAHADCTAQPLPYKSVCSDHC